MVAERLKHLCYLSTIYAQLIDSILVTNKAVDNYNRRNHEGLVFKLDLDEAYSRFDWSFMNVVLQAKGFGGKWRN